MKVKCKFCGFTLSKNGTRLTQHIKKCNKCPLGVKKLCCGSDSGTENASLRSSVSSIGDDSLSTVSESSFHSYDSQNLITRGLINTMTSAHQYKSKRSLARAIFASGMPMNFAESEYRQAFFRLLRPSFWVPSRHELSNSLLQQEFDEMSTYVSNMLTSRDNFVLMCDRRSNLRN